jgi:septum formation protein
MTIILASQSPRRKTLLARLTSDFVVIPSGADEVHSGPPCERAVLSARRKAEAVGSSREGVVLGADTIVVVDDRILGKPETREEAEAMLRLLSGRSHRVLTGLHLWNTISDVSCERCVETSVRFRDVSERELSWYLDTGEYVDKAGAYAIQGKAAMFVESIVGEYTNVMGLPLCELGLLLRKVGVAL